MLNKVKELDATEEHTHKNGLNEQFYVISILLQKSHSGG